MVDSGTFILLLICSDEQTWYSLRSTFLFLLLYTLRDLAFGYEGSSGCYEAAVRSGTLWS